MNRNKPDGESAQLEVETQFVGPAGVEVVDEALNDVQGAAVVVSNIAFCSQRYSNIQILS